MNQHNHTQRQDDAKCDIGTGAPAAIILAAGMGKRMRSDLPKVLHPVGKPPRPMVCAVIDACREAGCGRIVLVVGHKQELVREAIVQEYGERSGIEFAVQGEQLGTGHAVRCAEGLFAREISQDDQDVIVLAGDGPLIRAQTLRQLIERHRVTRALATLATSVIDDPTGYGRIVRTPTGELKAIVEHKDCSPEQLAIKEVNPSYYCFDTKGLFRTLAEVPRQASNGEYYITDVPALLLGKGERVEVIASVPAEDVLSINTPEQLAEVDAIYIRRAGSRRTESGAGDTSGRGGFGAGKGSCGCCGSGGTCA